MNTRAKSGRRASSSSSLCASLSTRTSSSARGNDADDDERKTTAKTMRRGGQKTRTTATAMSASKTTTSRREHVLLSEFLFLGMIWNGSRRAFADEMTLTEYVDETNNFHLSYPTEWVLEKKAGATALFKNPSVKYASIGVTVTPVRIDSLKEFGSLEDIGAKLVEAESKKQTTVPGGTFMERQSERESVDTKTTFYEYEYRLITTHGNKRVYNYVGVRDRTLFIVNAQAYEIEEGGESEADEKTRALYREVGRSFDVLK